MSTGRWLRALHTIRHLRPRQAFYYVWRRRLGLRHITLLPRAPRQRGGMTGTASQHQDQRSLGDRYCFTFLNLTQEFPRIAMDWRPQTVNRLWRYHLHYFDFLHDEGRPLAEKCALIDDWIKQNPQGCEPAWEPYTASLRIVNWCKFLWTLPPEARADHWLTSLFNQTRWLALNLEYHILANHFFENLKALVFAGAFFDGAEAKRWLALANRELRAQLREQQLSDGGHYERSPHYHCILLEGYLDLLSVSRVNAGVLDHALEIELGDTALRALTWLEQIRTPDDSIPLFNDSVEDATLRPRQIITRANQLGLHIPIDSNRQKNLIMLPATGLFGWKSAEDYFAIDCGDIGPAYQPGHTHCDFLSYVWMANGHWIVVDSGVCEYEPGPMRTYSRSTSSHNTVVVDGEEQSEIWGEFRVGRRAEKISAAITHAAESVGFNGAFRGFPTLGGIVHRRSANLDLAPHGSIVALRIRDDIEGDGNHTVESFLHLHPDLEVEAAPESVLLKRGGVTVAVFQTDPANRVDIIDSIYCPEFGKQLKNKAIRLHRQSRLPLSINYTLSVVLSL